MGVRIQLGDHITTQKGYAFKSKWYSDGGHPIVKVSDFTADSIDISNLVLIPHDIADEYRKYELKTNDVVIQTVGSWPSNPASVVGKTIRVPGKARGALLNQNAVKIEPSEMIDKGYLYHLLRDDAFKEFIIGTAQGAASQASITLDSIKAFKFCCPPLGEQRKIAEVLSAYDNLIENNNCRIAILEEMAQSLYREWFINFRFPSDETINFIDSSLGNIPSGWEVKKLADIADVNSENISPRNAPEEIKYIDIKSVGTDSVGEMKGMLFSEAPSRARRIVQNNDIIWATVRPNRKQYAFISRPKENTIVSTGFAVLRATKVPASYLYKAVTTDNFTSYLVNHATGAAYPAVNASIFENATVLVPESRVLKLFDAFASQITEHKECLKRKNDNLKLQRDLLLPKLISGMVTLEKDNNYDG